MNRNAIKRELEQIYGSGSKQLDVGAMDKLIKKYGREIVQDVIKEELMKTEDGRKLIAMTEEIKNGE